MFFPCQVNLYVPGVCTAINVYIHSVYLHRAYSFLLFTLISVLTYCLTHTQSIRLVWEWAVRRQRWLSPTPGSVWSARPAVSAETLAERRRWSSVTTATEATTPSVSTWRGFLKVWVAFIATYYTWSKLHSLTVAYCICTYPAKKSHQKSIFGWKQSHQKYLWWEQWPT